MEEMWVMGYSTKILESVLGQGIGFRAYAGWRRGEGLVARGWFKGG
jgi:hypothetical protein